MNAATPAMIAAGAKVLQEALGGNVRLHGAAELVAEIYAAMQEAEPPTSMIDAYRQRLGLPSGKAGR